MEITVTLIRNAASGGGMEGRFLGRIDEPPTPESLRLLDERVESGSYPEAQLVFSGGLERCLETARRIYPQLPAIVLPELTAFDYGDFSGKTYAEIAGDERFAQWAGADRMAACPGGEEPYAFVTRCTLALRHIVGEARKKRIERVGVITHLTVIKAIARRYYVPRSNYRDWSVGHGGGFVTSYDLESGALRTVRQI